MTGDHAADVAAGACNSNIHLVFLVHSNRDINLLFARLLSSHVLIAFEVSGSLFRQSAPSVHHHHFPKSVRALQETVG
uniref:hypothetical protein n=1 Tax=Neisseria elongata TaxID=495 RepID=UPI0028E4D27D